MEKPLATNEDFDTYAFPPELGQRIFALVGEGLDHQLEAVLTVVVDKQGQPGLMGSIRLEDGSLRTMTVGEMFELVIRLGADLRKMVVEAMKRQRPPEASDG